VADELQAQLVVVRKKARIDGDADVLRLAQVFLGQDQGLDQFVVGGDLEVGEKV